MIAIRYQTPFETIELREGETAKSLSPVGEESWLEQVSYSSGKHSLL